MTDQTTETAQQTPEDAAGQPQAPRSVFGQQNPPRSLEEAVFLSMGAASTCWDRINDAGTFDSDLCKFHSDNLVAYIRANYQPKPSGIISDTMICPSCGKDRSYPQFLDHNPPGEPQDVWHCEECGNTFKGRVHS